MLSSNVNRAHTYWSRNSLKIIFVKFFFEIHLKTYSSFFSLCFAQSTTYNHTHTSIHICTKYKAFAKFQIAASS